ncbi:MAG: hypothetical protein JXA77_01575 [Bacteroidales bacterium]|nr:hypothetical protein [Bacteroidales bacterium]MBN2820132.1 hypothetical protein [Bacteroidales bacterium]
MKRAVIAGFLIIFFAAGTFAQEAFLEIKGFVESLKGDVLSGVVAELYSGSSKVNSFTTGSDGYFSFKLDYGKSYKLIITKPGMIKKRIDFNTNVPADKQKKLVNEFGITLTESCEGANVSVFDEPVDIVEFDEGKSNFISNRSHFEKMQNRIVDAYLDIERCLADKLNDKINEADKALQDNNFSQAEKILKEALAMDPANSAVKKKIAEVRKAQEQQQVNDSKYEQLIKDAELYLAQNQLDVAKQRYSEALKLKPGDATAQNEIKKIDGIMAQKAEAAQKQQALDRQYDDVLKQANSALAAKNYPMAKQLFEQAKGLKPAEAYPVQKIAEAQQALQKLEQEKQDQERKDKEYSDAMAKGQSALQKGQFAEAEDFFRQALAIKPTEAEPRQSIGEAQRLAAQKKQQELDAQQAEIERKYNEAIQKADGLLAQNQFDASVAAYQDAMKIKPSDVYASEQIIKAQNLKVQMEKEKQSVIEQAYTQALADGDSKKLSQDFEGAIASYQQALLSKPGDAVAQSRVTEAQKLLADQQLKFKEESENRANYNQFVQEGDGLLKSEEYEQSRAKYQAALNLYPQESYPKNQVAKIDNILSKLETEAEYNKMVSEADLKFNQQDFNGAKTIYTSLVAAYPEKSYPKQKLNEISNLETNMARDQRQAEFDQLVADAEVAADQGEYDRAKNLLNKASAVIPESPYPQKRINEINALIDQLARDKKMGKYNELISQADGLFNQEQYNEAKTIYKQAQTENPESTYPQQKINEINQKISNKARLDIESQYNTAIAEADNYFNQQNYDAARASYQKASSILPEQTYPQTRINEINSILANAVKTERDKLETQSKYDQHITLADKFFNEKSYMQARDEYSRALGVFSDKDYPRTQIDKIESILADQQARDAQALETLHKYKEAVEKADNLFKARTYSESKNYYNQALGFKPGDVHSSSQIKRIDDILAQQNADKEKNAAVETKYNELISNADSKFSANDYTNARKSYYAALEVKPNEEYPRERIKIIDNKIKQLAVTNASAGSEKVNDTPKSNIEDINFKNESERANYLENLKKNYPPGVTLEIYTEGKKTTKRYVVIRNGEVHEYRDVSFTWGGGQYFVDGKPTNSLYVQKQVRPQEGEAYNEIKK